MLGLVAIVVSGVSFILNIVGLAIPYWLYLSQNSATSNAGLWKSCLSNDDQSLCVDYPDPDSVIKAVRALEILGMLVILAALVCLILKQFIMKEQQLLPKVGGGCAICAGLLMIIGTVIYATDDDVKLLTDAGYSLHAGFALCIVAGILGIVAGVLAFIGNKSYSLYAGFGLCIVAGILGIVAGVLAFIGNTSET